MCRPALHPCCSILPPHVMKHLAGSPRRRDREAALDTLRATERLRGMRLVLGDFLRAVSRGGLHRSVYDARHLERLPGTLVRDEGQKRTGDAAVDQAYDGLGATYAFYDEVLGRSSLDGNGLGLDASVHYGRRYMNAFWDGRQMVFGDGDGEIFGPFTRNLDIVGHELTHGVISHEAAFDYQDQPGALNESFADVFGSLVLQYKRKESAKGASWLIGKGLLVKYPRQALRSLKAPGTAYDNPLLGKDPQPSSFADYRPRDYPDDNGGVHVFSGIPNHAFYLAAMKLGGNAWDKAGRAWYLALTDLLGRTAQFSDAALATATAASRLFGAGAGKLVREAWAEVGVAPSTSQALARRTGARRRRRAA
jgi:Zn-dependent metalloprotease